MAISMLKIRRPLGRLIFNMGIAIPGKTVFLIETAPWSNGNHALYDPVHLCQECVSPIHLLCEGAPDLAPVPLRLFSNVITLHWHNVNVNKMSTLLKLRPTKAGDIVLTRASRIFFRPQSMIWGSKSAALYCMRKGLLVIGISCDS